MPSLVKYAHEILSEDRYGYRALERVNERIGSLNDAQLVGMISHLSGSMSRARSRLWRDANGTVLETVKDEFEIREEEHRIAEQRDWMENREERERAEMDQMRSAEKAAAEKQISRTAEREAREDVAKMMQEFTTQAKIKLMNDTYRARNIRQYTWTFSILGFIAIFVAVDIMEKNRTTADLTNQYIIYAVGFPLTVISFLIGWRFGEAVEQKKSQEEIDEMIRERKEDKLVEFHERDREIRKQIAIQDEIDMREKEARIAARRAEKKRLKRIAKKRKTELDQKMKDLEEKRKVLFLKGTGDGEKDVSGGGVEIGGGAQGLLSIAATAALKAVEEGVKKDEDKALDKMETGEVPETQVPMYNGKTDQEIKELERSNLVHDLEATAMAIENRRKTEDVKKVVEEFGGRIKGRGNRLAIVPTKGSGGEEEGRKEEVEELLTETTKKEEDGEEVEVKIVQKRERKVRKTAGFRRESQGLVQIMGE